MKLTEAMTPTGIPQSTWEDYMPQIDSDFNRFFERRTHFFQSVKPVSLSISLAYLAKWPGA